MSIVHQTIWLYPILLASCMQGPRFLKQSGAPVRNISVTTVDQNGATTGTITAGSRLTQVIAASANSPVAGSSAEFPPGALAVNTEVTIQVGDSLSNANVLSQLNITSGLASAGTAVAFTSSVPTDAVTPFTIAIPLPDSSSLALADAFDNLIVIYHINKAASGNADYTGIIGRAAIDVSSGYARFAVSHFGTFQAVITVNKVEAVEIAAAPQTTPAPPKVAPTGANTRFYFVRGPTASSFGNDAPQQSGNFQGWVHAVSPAKVGNNSTVTFGRISKALPFDGK